MFGFWKKKYEETSRKLSENQLKISKIERNLLDEAKKKDKFLSNQEKAIKELIEDNMTGYIKCGNELFKVGVESFSGSAGESPEINCVVIKDA